MDLCGKSNQNLQKNNNEVKKQPDQNQTKPTSNIINEKITKEDIYIFIDTHFQGRNKEINTILKHFEYQDISTMAKVFCSTEFQELFPSRKDIEQLPKKDLEIFIELFIMIPLRYIYWRKVIKYENLFPITNQNDEEICWAHAIAALVVLSLRKIIGRKPPTFDEVMDFIFSKFERRKYSLSEVLPTILSHYHLHYELVPEDQINLFNPYGSYNCHLCRFYFTGKEWKNFSNHFYDEKTKNKFLTSEDLSKTPLGDYNEEDDGGHVVVLIDSDKCKHTCRNSWGSNWANNGQFTFKHGAIKNAEFYVFYWLESELPDEIKLCYQKRVKECIKAFYQIIEYINALMKMKSEEVKKVRNEHIITILSNFCEDFWNSDEITHFRNPNIFTENVFDCIHTDKVINDLNIFGNPCVKAVIGCNKGYSLISSEVKMFKVWIDANVVTDNLVLNYLSVFRHAFKFYPEYLKECFNEQIPDCKTNGQDRTVAERISDNLVWMTTNLWMKGKISGKILKIAINLGYELQQQGFINPDVNNYYINSAFSIINREGWNEIYPGLK